MPIIFSILQYFIYFLWFISSVYVIIGCMGLFYKPKRNNTQSNNVELVIVSIASSNVRDALFQCIERSISIIKKPVYVLIDEGCDLYNELISTHNIINVVLVPRRYRQDLIGKGRSINYFIESTVDETKWYGFLDDDNLLLDDKFLYEIDYYKELGYVASNPVLIPRQGRNSLCFIMDWVRYFDDITTFRLFTGLIGTPLKGLHGELLLVDGKILKEIGFGFRSVVEDFRFSIELVKRHYKVWQSATKVSILSPNSMTDLFKQRSRWAKGVFNDIRYCPLGMKLFISICLSMWYLGFFASWAFSPLWFIYFGSFWYALPGAIYYWTNYIYGTYKAGKLYLIVIIPILNILESLAMFLGFFKNNRKFVVIDKS